MLAMSEVKAVLPEAPVLDKVKSSPLNAVAVEDISKPVPVVSELASMSKETPMSVELLM